MERRFIRWTDREQYQLATSYKEVVESGTAFGFGACFEAAQKNLIRSGAWDISRARSITSATQVPWLNTKLKEICDEQDRQAENKKQQEELSKIVASLGKVKTEDLIKELLSRTNLSLNLDLIGLLQPLVSRLVSNAVSAQLAKLEETTYKKVEEEKPTVPEIKKSKIVIVGLLASQVTVIKKRFEEKFNLVFLRSDVSSAHLKSVLANTSLVLFLTKFNSHSTYQIVHSSNVPVRFANGAISDLSSILSGIDNPNN